MGFLAGGAADKSSAAGDLESALDGEASSSTLTGLALGMGRVEVGGLTFMSAMESVTFFSESVEGRRVAEFGIRGWK